MCTEISVHLQYVSCACNRTPEIADWNADGLICFGTSNAVVIYDTNKTNTSPVSTLSKHTNKINTVKWIQNANKHSLEIISGSADNTATIWSSKENTWIPSSTLTGHTDGVMVVEAIYRNPSSNDDLIIFTSSAESTIKIWERIQGVVKCIQTIPRGSGLCLSMKAGLFPGISVPFFFCALDDHKIYLFSESLNSSDNKEYVKTTTLLGHEDWVRGLDVMETDSGSLMLASSSQDTYIRLWKIRQFQDVKEEEPGLIKIEQRLFTVKETKWSVILEAVLSGHEGWVYGVHWHPKVTDESGHLHQPMKLLSVSIDKTIIVWEPENIDSGDEIQGVWIEKVRVGEVGGNGLGFYGGKFGPQGESIMGHGYSGSFHIWDHNKETNDWQPRVVCGGHFGEVADISWEPQAGIYLTSVSTDQTTRIHAPWVRNNTDLISWHEVARPQVHGYDMSSLAMISSTKFVSAADEKVIRVFQAPHNFIQNFKNITLFDLASEKDKMIGSNLSVLSHPHRLLGRRGRCSRNPYFGSWRYVRPKSYDVPEGASVPSLGLSNKAVYNTPDENKPSNKNYPRDHYFVPVDSKEPPTEETLMQNSLWPEIQKLYGHGYEVFALDASRDSSLVASACKATNAEHAAILIWETSTWLQIQKLVSHQLTVTQLAFSPDSTHLLSVSRDRRWSLFKRTDPAVIKLNLVATSDKKNGIHARIIWCCAWSHDSKYFATGSRDGKVCVWGNTNNDSHSSLGTYGPIFKTLELPAESVTALAFAPTLVDNKYLVSIGFESGVINIYTLDLAASEHWRLVTSLNKSMAHHLTVKKIEFRPVMGCAGSTKINGNTMQMASCGADNMVKVYNIETK